MGKRKIKNKKKEEEKIEIKEEKIKPFTLKSAFFIFISSMIGSWIVPMILVFLGIKNNLAVVIGNTFITSFGFVWTRNFIDNKKEYSRDFWMQYLTWAIIFGLISYFWLFRKSYI